MSNVSSATTLSFELKRLFTLMLPILITQFSQAGLGLIDTIMAGHLSATDLAAIAVGVGLWIPVMLLFSGIMIATTPLVAEALRCSHSRENFNDCPSIPLGSFSTRGDRRTSFADFTSNPTFAGCAGKLAA